MTNHSKIEASNLAVATNMKQTSWFPIEYIYPLHRVLSSSYHIV